jgi:glucan phosphoethanolaminetransferase (alkaline phosphatase superfamily)
LASDHNELLGENGTYGHRSAYLTSEVIQISIVVHSSDSTFLKKINHTFAITHYKIAKLLVEQIGFNVINPNEEENVCMPMVSTAKADVTLSVSQKIS